MGSSHLPCLLVGAQLAGYRRLARVPRSWDSTIRDDYNIIKQLHIRTGEIVLFDHTIFHGLC